MHERLLNEEGEVRPGDHITKPVIKDMVCSMLSDDPDGRENAIVLWKRSQKILVKGQKQLEKIGQQQSPPIGNYVVGNLQASDQRAAETSEQINGQSHVHGPPPFDPRYSSSFQSNGRSYSPQQPLKKRSDTWHDPSSTRRITSGLHIMSPSSPTSPHQFARTSSPPDNYSVNREQIDTRPTIAEETTDRAREMWQGANSLESESAPQHGTGESTPPESKTSPKSHMSRQLQNGAGLEPIHLQGIQEGSTFGPPPKFDAQY